MNQENPADMQKKQKGGGITLAIAIVFFLLLANPFIATITGHYESDMVIPTVFFGIPCLLVGTISGIAGVTKGKRKCGLALAIMWIPISVIFILAIILGIK